MDFTAEALQARKGQNDMLKGKIASYNLHMKEKYRLSQANRS